MHIVLLMAPAKQEGTQMMKKVLHDGGFLILNLSFLCADVAVFRALTRNQITSVWVWPADFFRYIHEP